MKLEVNYYRDNKGCIHAQEFKFFPQADIQIFKSFTIFEKDYNNRIYKFKTTDELEIEIPMDNCWLQIAYKNTCFY